MNWLSASLITALALPAAASPAATCRPASGGHGARWHAAHGWSRGRTRHCGTQAARHEPQV